VAATRIVTKGPRLSSRPLVSIGISVFNGERFLREALESLLAQDYQNIEIVVLDNQSVDGTQRICAELASRDSRIRFVVDDRRRDVMDGQRRACELTSGKYFMVACDDDVYDPRYISRLMEEMTANPELAVVYAAHAHIYPDGSKKAVGVPEKFFFSPTSAPARNFATYLRFRFPVPLVFGIVRVDLHREALSYFIRVDENGWDHDNLYVLRLLSLGRAMGLREVLFYYRQRDRSGYIPSIRGGPLAHFYKKALHQVAVSRMVARIIASANFTPSERRWLRVYNLWVCAVFCTLKYMVNTPFAERLRQPLARLRGTGIADIHAERSVGRR
jgi:glycosyltransferase involved in cell wall biosynthesis